MTIYTTDFSDQTIGGAVTGFTSLWNSGTLNVAGGYFDLLASSDRGLEMPVHGTGARRCWAWNGAADSTNQEQLALVRMSVVSANELRLFCLASGSAGSETAYFVEPITTSGAIALARYKDGSANQLATLSAKYLPHKYLWFRLRASGGTIQIKIWGFGLDEPAGWDLSHTDSSPISTAGKVGVGHFNHTGVSNILWLGASSAGETVPLPDLAAGQTLKHVTTDFSNDIDVAGERPRLLQRWGSNLQFDLETNAGALGGWQVNMLSGQQINSNTMPWLPTAVYRMTGVENQEILTKLYPTAGFYCPRVRWDGVGFSTGYALSLTDTELRIIRDTTTLTAVPLPVAYNQWLWVRMRAFGSTISVRVWADGTSEPGDWSASVTDATYADGVPVIGQVYGALSNNYGLLFDYLAIATDGETALGPGESPPDPGGGAVLSYVIVNIIT
jgi:hypothetical protein